MRIKTLMESGDVHKIFISRQNVCHKPHTMSNKFTQNAPLNPASGSKYTIFFWRAPLKKMQYGVM